MTTGQKLVELSGLASGSALAHLLAMQTGTGPGQTIFASMFTLRCDEPRLTLVQRAKREAGESVERAMRQIDERSDGDVSVLTGTARMSVRTTAEWLTVTPQRETQVFIQRDVQRAVVRQSDVLTFD